MKTQECERCKGSGEIGVRTSWNSTHGFPRREAPGPVPETARGWMGVDCPDCHGRGSFEIDEDEGEDE